MNLDNFDANSVEPTQAFDLIANGWYEAIISNSEEKITQAGDKALNLTFTLTRDPYKGRFQWDLLNINHSTSPQAKQIARGTLSAIGRAVGVLLIKDSTQLHNLPLLIKIGSEKRKDNEELKNVIKGYKSRDAASASKEETRKLEAVPPAGGPALSGPAAAPWLQKKAQ